MTAFWVLLALFWLVAVAAWLLLTRARRTTEAGRIRSRLLGGAEEKRRRAARKAPALLPQEKSQRGRLVLGLLERFRLGTYLRDLIEQAGLRWEAARLAQGCLALALGVFALGSFLLPAGLRYLTLPAALVAGSLPLLYVLRKRRRRLRHFEEQFPESLEFVSRSMRAGHAFSVSLEMLHREFQDPLAGEFRRTFDEHNLGLPLEAALEKLARRIPLMDVHFFVSAVMLQKRTGGNLAELLDKLAHLIRERFKLRGRIRAVSAHGRMTGMALTIIPIVVALMMFWVNREYVTFFWTDPTGQKMAAAAIGLQIIGYGVIKRIVNIEA